MTYTEAQVSALLQIQSESLSAEVAELKSRLHKEGLLREEAEKKYQKLCESCITAYTTHKDIITDCLLVQVSVPRFLSAPDFETGILHIIKSLSEKRREAVSIHEQTQSRRDRNETT